MLIWQIWDFWALLYSFLGERGFNFEGEQSVNTALQVDYHECSNNTSWLKQVYKREEKTSKNACKNVFLYFKVKNLPKNYTVLQFIEKVKEIIFQFWDLGHCFIYKADCYINKRALYGGPISLPWIRCTIETYHNVNQMCIWYKFNECSFKTESSLIGQGQSSSKLKYACQIIHLVKISME